jgi:hypothetical protein
MAMGRAGGNVGGAALPPTEFIETQLGYFATLDSYAEYAVTDQLHSPVASRTRPKYNPTSVFPSGLPLVHPSIKVTNRYSRIPTGYRNRLRPRIFPLEISERMIPKRNQCSSSDGRFLNQ